MRQLMCLSQHFRYLTTQTAAIDHVFASKLPSGIALQNFKEIRRAAFVKSSTKVAAMPCNAPEIAVIGQSNVGKSSLVNLLTGQEELALVSKQPGKTKTVNHFFIDNKWYLVDCPGYGYAKVSKEQRASWHNLTQEYFMKHKTLAHVLLLVDSSLPPQAVDVDAAIWLSQHSVPYTLVFTKVDLCMLSSVQQGSTQMPPPDHAQHQPQGPAATMHTFCNAVSTILQQQQRIARSRDKQRQQRVCPSEAPAACAPYAEKILNTMTEPPYHIPTSAAMGLGRDTLLSYLQAVTTMFRMPPVFR